MPKFQKEQLIEDAIDNIKSDRNQAQLLLTKIIEYMLKNEDRQKDISFSAAKYLETLQRSNEQLVKLIQVLKKEDGAESGLSDEDKESLLEELNDYKE